MNTPDFVRKLKTIVSSNGDQGGQHQFLQEWDLNKKIRRFEFPDDPVFNLVNQYDCSSLCIGLINFYKDLKESNDTIAFADFIEDTLIVNLDTLEVQVIDLYSGDIKLLCSPDTEAFVESLATYAEFVNQEQRGIAPSEEELSSIFKKLAGINERDVYHRFWKMLLGLEPIEA